jgi:hypothetical protein
MFVQCTISDGSAVKRRKRLAEKSKRGDSPPNQRSGISKEIPNQRSGISKEIPKEN